MTDLNYGAYLLALNTARRQRGLDLAGPPVFSEAKHRRDLKGRFAPGTSVKHFLTGDVGKVTSVDEKKGTVAVQYPQYDAPSSYRAKALIPKGEKAPTQITDGHDAEVWGAHHGVGIDAGTKLNGETWGHVTRTLQAILEKHPELKGKIRVKAASSIDKKDMDAAARAFLDSNPKAVMTADRNGSIFINDLHRADEINRGDMKSLTNPAGDKHVSDAHSDLGGLVAHEIGHTHQDIAGLAAWKAGDKERNARVETLFQQLGTEWIGKHVSHRAAESSKELYAEAFALLHSQAKLTTAVRKKLEQVVA